MKREDFKDKIEELDKDDNKKITILLNYQSTNIRNILHPSLE